jgi:hypothetical protein
MSSECSFWRLVPKVFLFLSGSHTPHLKRRKFLLGGKGAAARFENAAAEVASDLNTHSAFC